MNIIVTGANGQLGREALCAARARGMDALGIDIGDLDITNAAAARAFFSAHPANALVHCAAYTQVDRAEDDENACFRVNTLGTQNLALAARENGMKMIYISTDYVFDGSGQAPWRANAVSGAPLNAYGRSKLAGENAVCARVEKHFIVRTSWLFGAGGGNFVKAMLRIGREKGFARVVDDQIGAPTYAKDLARLLTDMLVTEEYGAYHATNEGECSFCDFAREIFLKSGVNARAVPISTREYAARAKRPLNSRLDKSCLDARGFQRLPAWTDALKRYLIETGEIRP